MCSLLLAKMGRLNYWNIICYFVQQNTFLTRKWANPGSFCSFHIPNQMTNIQFKEYKCTGTKELVLHYWELSSLNPSHDCLGHAHLRACHRRYPLQEHPEGTPEEPPPGDPTWALPASNRYQYFFNHQRVHMCAPKIAKIIIGCKWKWWFRN